MKNLPSITFDTVFHYMWVTVATYVDKTVQSNHVGYLRNISGSEAEQKTVSVKFTHGQTIARL